MLDSVEWPTFGYGELLQLRLDSQQRRAHPGADPAGPERVEERHGDVRCIRGRYMARQSANHALAWPAPGSLPARSSGTGGTGRQKFAAIDSVITFNNWGPRAGHQRRSHGRRQDRRQAAIRQLLAVPGHQLHGCLQSESDRLDTDTPLDQRRERERPMGSGRGGCRDISVGREHVHSSRSRDREYARPPDDGVPRTRGGT